MTVTYSPKEMTKMAERLDAMPAPQRPLQRRAMDSVWRKFADGNVWKLHLQDDLGYQPGEDLSGMDVVQLEKLQMRALAALRSWCRNHEHWCKTRRSREDPEHVIVQLFHDPDRRLRGPKRGELFTEPTEPLQPQPGVRVYQGADPSVVNRPAPGTPAAEALGTYAKRAPSEQSETVEDAETGEVSEASEVAEPEQAAAPSTESKGVPAWLLSLNSSASQPSPVNEDGTQVGPVSPFQRPEERD